MQQKSTRPANSSGATRYKSLQVYRLTTFISCYCLRCASEQSLISKLFHLFSKAYYFDQGCNILVLKYEFIHTTKSSVRHCRIGLNRTSPYPNSSHNVAVTIYSTSITLRPTRGCNSNNTWGKQ